MLLAACLALYEGAKLLMMGTEMAVNRIMIDTITRSSTKLNPFLSRPRVRLQSVFQTIINPLFKEMRQKLRAHPQDQWFRRYHPVLVHGDPNIHLALRRKPKE